MNTIHERKAEPLNRDAQRTASYRIPLCILMLLRDDAQMRTTIDLPPDLHDLARQLAHDTRRSMSDVVIELIRQGLGGQSTTPPASKRGMPRVSVGRAITAEDVRSLEDEG